MLKRSMIGSAVAILFWLSWPLLQPSFSANFAPTRMMQKSSVSTDNCPPFSLQPLPVLTRGRVGTQYRYQIEVSAHKPSPRFKVIKGRLPDGLRMDSQGQITGIPSRPGRYQFMVQASLECSSRVKSVQATFSIEIQRRDCQLSAETQPKSIRVTGSKDGAHLLRYLLKCTPAGGLKLYSADGRFMVHGRIVGRSTQTLTVNIKKDQSWVTENLVIPKRVIAGALKSGAREITYVRDFASRQPPVTVQTRLTIRIASTAGIGNKNLKSSLAGKAVPSLPQSNQDETQPVAEDKLPASSFMPGQIVVTTEVSPRGRSAIQRLIRKYPLKTAESYKIRTLRQIVTVFTTSGDVMALIKQIRREGDIKHVQANRLFKTYADPLDDLQSIYSVLNLPDLHRYYQGEGVRVAIIDTGVDYRHPDLRSRVIEHANLLRNNPYRPEIHGTAMAGIIAAAVNDYGISGIAPRAELIALRACWQTSGEHPEGHCTSVSVAKALDVAIESNARIVNMSFGATAPDRLMMQLLDAGAKRSILFVAAVGNHKDLKKIPFPASHSKVLAVAGLDEQGAFYPNADLASAADVCAPADNILTTVPGGRHNFMSGTSLSAAIVSGLLATAKEKNRYLNLKAIPPYDGDLCRWQERLINQSICHAATLQGRKK